MHRAKALYSVLHTLLPTPPKPPHRSPHTSPTSTSLLCTRNPVSVIVAQVRTNMRLKNHRASCVWVYIRAVHREFSTNWPTSVTAAHLVTNNRIQHPTRQPDLGLPGRKNSGPARRLTFCTVRTMVELRQITRARREPIGTVANERPFFFLSSPAREQRKG